MPTLQALTMTHGRALALLVASLFVQGCPEERATWIGNASRASAITLVFGRVRGRPEPTRVSSLYLYRCQVPGRGNGIEFIWRLNAEANSAKLDSLVLGQVPRGYTSDPDTLPALSGCYTAANGDAQVDFVVRPDSTVVELRP